LGLIAARVVGITFVSNILGVYLDDRPADAPSLRVPGDMIADFECLFHQAWPHCSVNLASDELEQRGDAMSTLSSARNRRHECEADYGNHLCRRLRETANRLRGMIAPA
jgi:hypothetical protein